MFSKKKISKIKGYPIPLKKWESNYKYLIKNSVQVESRESYIKNLRATALYMEDEVTDDEFHEMATGLKPIPKIETYKFIDMEKI